MICLVRSVSSVSRCSQRRAADRSEVLHASRGLVQEPGRSRAHAWTVTANWPWVRCSRRSAGAVSNSAWMRLATWVRALTADRRVARSCRKDSLIVVDDFGSTRPSPASTVRAAASASIGSDLPRVRRIRRLGRHTSCTVASSARSRRVSPAP